MPNTKDLRGSVAIAGVGLAACGALLAGTIDAGAQVAPHASTAATVASNCRCR